MKSIILNTSIITQNEKREILHGYDIFIEESRITSIEKTGLLNRVGYNMIDGSDFFVCPGFINVHVHLGESVYKNNFSDYFGLSEYINKTTLISSKKTIVEENRTKIAHYSIEKLIIGGSTTISGGRVSQISQMNGVRCSSFYMLMNNPKLKKYYGEFNENITKDIESGTAQGIFIHSLNKIDLGYLSVIKSIQDKYNIRVCIHIGETVDQENEIYEKYAKYSLQILDQYGLLNDKLLLVHCNVFNQEDFELIKGRGCYIVHCLKSNIKVTEKTLDLGFVDNLRDHMCIATDGLITSGGLNMIHEMNFNYLYHNRFLSESLRAQDILDMCTINPANAIGIKDIGSLEQGKFADMLFFKKEGDNLIMDIVYYQSQPFGVMINGKIKIWDYQLVNNGDYNIDEIFLPE